MVIPIDQKHQPVAGKSVLLTGSRGFTGAYARAEFEAQGMRVVGTALEHPGCSLDRQLDIVSLEACRAFVDEIRPDFIVHLAASSFVADSDAVEMYRVNVVGTLNLLQACQDVQHVPKKTLIASSANVYGNVTGMVRESAPFAPVTHYGASKAAMEYLVRTWFDRLPIVVTRPFNYTGCGQNVRFLVPKIVDRFVRRDAYIALGNIDIARDFSDVRSVVGIYRRLLASDVVSESVNVCCGHAYSLKEILERVCDLSGHKLDLRVDPDLVRANEVVQLSGCADRLRELVPDAPVIPFEATLEWMVRDALDQQGTPVGAPV